METMKITTAPMSTKGKPVVGMEIPLKSIKLGNNSRLDISAESIEGLKQSIKASGLLQPIGVVDNNDGTYEICYGNRRYAACKALGMKNIPAFIHQHVTQTETDMKNLAENVQRTNLTPVEFGRYVDLLKSQGLSYGKIAKQLGYSKSHIESMSNAYRKTPQKYAKQIMPTRTGKPVHVKGMIKASIAKTIANEVRVGRIDTNEANRLLEIAKTDDKLTRKNVAAYAIALRKRKDPKRVDKLVAVSVSVYLKESHKKQLLEKHVTGGKYRSLTGLFADILRGESDVVVDVIK